YLGKKEIVLTSLDIDVNISEKKVKENILELITPIVLNLCSDVKCRLDFNNLSIKSDNLIGSSRKINIKESFSSYLKELNIK
ncbi:hypothetical protein N9O83_03415, partial [Flavobacteriales bacterium]|nr:hypothetical protein [Flavobacteriales bacterium]